MGFGDAIERSDWDGARKADALRLCGAMRACLDRPDYAPDPNCIYKNLDSDRLVPDAPLPARPASRQELLRTLLDAGPPEGEELKTEVGKFCHSHKMQGPEDPAARQRVLGRAWGFDRLWQVYAKTRRLDPNNPGPLNDAIRLLSLEKQREHLSEVPLAEHVMWSFYDPRDQANPFASFAGGRAELVDRLGLGEYSSRSHTVIKWGHCLPESVTPTTPTAWDGGVNRPYWLAGGRTLPLSAAAARDTTNGLPEVVHCPVTGSQLAIRIAVVSD